jgi:hypothetical protein
MPLRLIPLDAQHTNIVALLHGPLALFAIDPGTKALTRNQLMAARKLASDSTDWEVATEQGRVRMKPFAAITHERR